MKKYIILGVIILALLAGAAYAFRDKAVEYAFQPNLPETNSNTNSPATIGGDPEIVAENLSVPWEIVFLPDGDMLITERVGTVKRIGKTNGSYPISGVKAGGEGGLLGLALHPNFSSNQLVYVYFTTTNGTNKIEQYRLGQNGLSDKKTVIENIPGASNHDGGRIAFGPDGKLYITTGDAQTESNSQNTSSLAGKILRINDDGSIPSDNPFKNAVYSYGHRNPQGLAWDNQGRLWATEHGRSGARSGYDELNLIEKGGNYGWPEMEGDSNQPGMLGPVSHSGANTTWAPAGIAIAGNNLYFAGLRGQSVFTTTITGDSVGNVTPLYTRTYGRLRALTIHDGYLYFSSSNKDGRGSAKPGDDKIFRVKLQ